MSKSYPAPYTSTFYMCLMASIQCVAIALSAEHNVSAWSLHSTIRLTSALYAVYLHIYSSYNTMMNWFIYLIIVVIIILHSIMLVSGDYFYWASVCANVMDHREERSPLCVCVLPFAACHHCCC